MRIDIDKLTESELIDLNHRIVERLKFLQVMRAHGRCWSSALEKKSVFIRLAEQRLSEYWLNTTEKPLRF